MLKPFNDTLVPTRIKVTVFCQAYRAMPGLARVLLFRFIAHFSLPGFTPAP